MVQNLKLDCHKIIDNVTVKAAAAAAKDLGFSSLGITFGE